MRSAAVLIFIISILRLRLTSATREKGAISDSQWFSLKITVWLNALGWSIVCTVASLEHHFSGIHFIVATTIICGFVSSSLITLSADLTLFMPFQIFLLGPQIAIMTWDILNENKYQVAPLLPVYSMYLFYQMKQVKDFRVKLIQNFIHQLELKESNEELQKSQEAQLEQTVKLIHTSRLAALGEMAAGIAHEVNNPLAIISGSLQQLERRIARHTLDEKETLLKHTGRSQQSIDRITRIISGLRLFSQQSDTLPKVQIALHEIVDDTLNFCAEMLKARYVRLDVGSIPDVKIECHPVQISQVLINLIKNAEDALEYEVDVEQRWVKLIFVDEGQQVFIHVVNGGPGIPLEIQDRLFLPFFTTKGVGKGTGLGLSISRGIMKEHGGDLIYNGDETQTTFTIVLPVVEYEASESSF